jgi:hypothetical protein
MTRASRTLKSVDLSVTLALGLLLASSSAASAAPFDDIAREIEARHTQAIVIPDLRRRADTGDTPAKCILAQLYEDKQAAPRTGEDVSALRYSCAAHTHRSNGGPPPPLVLPPPR